MDRDLRSSAIVAFFGLPFVVLYHATWPYSGYFFLAFLLVCIIWEELRCAAREKARHDRRD